MLESSMAGQNDFKGGKRTWLARALSGTSRAALVIWLLALLAWTIFFTRLNKAREANPAPAKSTAQSEADRAAKLQRARAASYIKPTVSARMGDVDPGGKYFGQVPDPAKTRHYYIAVESDKWDYLPSGSDPVCGIPLTPDILGNHSVWKARYFQYTDASFTKRVPQTSRLGILGPVLRGVVGEYLAVTFLNREIGGVYSMHPHGVKYDKDSEGSYHSDFADKAAPRDAKNSDGATSFQGRGAAIGYNARFTYVWYLDESSGPLPSEPSSKAWLYHSHVNAESEANAGLEGFIIVTDPKRARPDGTPVDVDREMAALFMIYDESGLNAEAQERLAASGDSEQWINFQKMREAGQRHAINGYIYGNLPGLDMNEGERVRWYLFGLGSENDLHTAHWHGLRAVEDGRRTDTVELLPASMKVADMVADNPGSWLFHCHVAEHMANGMFARVTVYPTNAPGVSRDPEKAFFGLQ
ncbi:MAG TPA: multicopper oxidase domain-containing protein [Verrucomicrobiae bacterium]